MAFVDIQNVSKHFGATRALQRVSLALDRGEIHGLVGENGAGKSTLMKVLSGVITPDEGTVLIDGAVLQRGDPKAAREAGIGIAFQELSSPPNISVAMKLCLRDTPKNVLGMIAQKHLMSHARRILDEYRAPHIPVDALICEVDLATKQQIEIIAGMRDAKRLLVLDEPTAALPDTAWLFARIRHLANQGTSIIYISHKLNEIEAICSQGTVIRNGRNVGNFKAGQQSEKELVELMIGRSFEHTYPKKRDADVRAVEPIVMVNCLSAGKVKNVSFSIYPGEVLGVAALEGQGQHDLFYALAGITPRTGGQVQIDRGSARRDTALVPEERKAEALFLQLSSLFNLTISTLSDLSRVGLVSKKRERALGTARADGVHLPHTKLDKPVSALSGGNQQKVVFGRALSQDPGCLILFDPTRGVDIPTKVELYDLIRSYAQSGRAVLMYSTELPELVGVCDRVLSMHSGQFTGEFTGALVSESNILKGALNLESMSAPRGTV